MVYITAMYQCLTSNWLLKIWDSAPIALLLRNTEQLVCSGGCRRDDIATASDFNGGSLSSHYGGVLALCIIPCSFHGFVFCTVICTVYVGGATLAVHDDSTVY